MAVFLHCASNLSEVLQDAREKERQRLFEMFLCKEIKKHIKLIKKLRRRVRRQQFKIAYYKKRMAMLKRKKKTEKTDQASQTEIPLFAYVPVPSSANRQMLWSKNIC